MTNSIQNSTAASTTSSSVQPASSFSRVFRLKTLPDVHSAFYANLQEKFASASKKVNPSPSKNSHTEDLSLPVRTKLAPLASSQSASSPQEQSSSSTQSNPGDLTRTLSASSSTRVLLKPLSSNFSENTSSSLASSSSSVAASSSTKSNPGDLIHTLSASSSSRILLKPLSFVSKTVTSPQAHSSSSSSSSSAESDSSRLIHSLVSSPSTRALLQPLAASVSTAPQHQASSTSSDISVSNLNRLSKERLLRLAKKNNMTVDHKCDEHEIRRKIIDEIQNQDDLIALMKCLKQCVESSFEGAVSLQKDLLEFINTQWKLLLNEKSSSPWASALLGLEDHLQHKVVMEFFSEKEIAVLKTIKGILDKEGQKNSRVIALLTRAGI